MPSTFPNAPVPQGDHEPRPDPQALTSNPDPSQNAPTNVDYTPHPKASLKVTPEREAIVKAITNLYSGSASEEDMKVYAEKAVYDDPWSFCDTRYKIAGQWYGVFFLPSPPSILINFHPYDNCRHTQSHGLVPHPRHRNRRILPHDPRLEANAGIYAKSGALLEAGG